MGEGPGPWRVRLVSVTGSTNADVADAARAGEPGGLVVVAEEQTAGRGRLDRRWTAPAGSALTFSVLLRPEPEQARWGWLPLLAGLAVAEAVQGATGVDVRLKWPNDLLVGEGKLGGLLAERLADAVVLGVGLNVTLEAPERPVPTATSLLLAGARPVDRALLLGRVLDRLAQWLRDWTAVGGDPLSSGLRAAYLQRCATVGSRVTVDRADGPLVGTAAGLDAEGRLVVHTPDGREVALAAGDVVHLR